MNISLPLISVILPVYNAENTLGEAIESILNQTFANFELILINDGSTDDSEKIVLSYEDKRIKYFSNERNKGLIYTLNRGLRLARGKYIARMDADDISLPTRFEKQVRILEENPSIIVCGSRIAYFGIKKRKSVYIAPESSEENKKWLVRESCFAHPTVMMRKEVLINNRISYHPDYKNAEDYKLWIDLAPYGEFYNIQEVLLNYRLSSTQITQSHNTEQKKNARRCRREYVSYLLKQEQLPEKIDITTIHAFRKYRRINPYIPETLYMSLHTYDMLALLYYIFSFDWMHISRFSNLAILKRFLKGKNPLV